jgi:1,4-dihydroxy-2-naphthoate octaprenyltransferase
MHTEAFHLNNLKYLLGPMRPPFLILTPACVLVGLGTAVWTTGRVSTFYFILTLIGAISTHISVNAFNEYFDFKSGLDLRTKRTPFSGGSGTLPEHPPAANQTLATAIVSLSIAGLIGLYFLYARGLALLPLGLLGFLIIVAYSPWVAYHPLLSLIAPGLGFGPLMVMGTHFVLTGHYSWIALVGSLVPFFLVNNLLLLNQFPDVEADKTIGRKNAPIVLGKRVSCLIYGVFLLLTYLSIVLGVSFGYLPAGSLLGLGTLVIAVPSFIGVMRYAEDTTKLIPSMGMNVVINIATPVLVAIGFFL